MVLTIINLSIGPVINKAVGVGNGNGIFANPWATANCKALKDGKDLCQNDICEKQSDSQIDYCTRAKGMHDMEYTAFIFDNVSISPNSFNFSNVLNAKRPALE